jgi:hypothetical protein
VGVPMFQGAGPTEAGHYIKIPLQGTFAAGVWLSTSYSKNGEVALGLKGFSDDISPLVIDGVGLSSLHAPFLTIEYPPGQPPSVPAGLVPVNGAVGVTGFKAGRQQVKIPAFASVHEAEARGISGSATVPLVSFLWALISRSVVCSDSLCSVRNC